MSRKGFKGFSKGLICKGKQYTEGLIFEEARAEPCEIGMHFCENSLAILRQYPPTDGNEFAEVVSLADDKTDDGQKFATTKLKIETTISLPALIKAGISFVFDRVKKSADKKTSSGYRSTSTTSGYSSTSATSGNRSTSATSGSGSTAKAAGKNSIAG